MSYMTNYTDRCQQNPSWPEIRVLPCPVQEVKGTQEGEKRWNKAPSQETKSLSALGHQDSCSRK